MIKVSVIIPAFNAGKWIRETLKSMICQDLPYFEVIVVNDGSTDDTADVVRNFPLVKLVNKCNGGLGSARNAGIKVARGEYVAFVDADDLWFPQKLRRQIDLVERTGFAWVYCDGYVFDDTTGRNLYRFSQSMSLHRGYILPQLLLECFIPSPTPMIRRRVFEEVGYFDEDKIIHMREDWDMWLRIAARYPIGLVAERLVRYRLHGSGNTSREDPLIALKSRLAVIEKAITHEPERLAPLKPYALSSLYVGTGRTLVRRGELAQARRMFLQAAKWTPYFLSPYFYWLSCSAPPRVLRLAINSRQLWRQIRYDLMAPDRQS
ncbi:glycosyltransferase [Candidatus Bathyarchaeota archaeon]|nr:MAG: glycosyltransferase [Candidatus Bathyarchaeota archaeon]